jgi:hypothetical protein
MKSCKLNPPPTNPRSPTKTRSFSIVMKPEPVRILAEYLEPLRILRRLQVAREREG